MRVVYFLQLSAYPCIVRYVIQPMYCEDHLIVLQHRYYLPSVTYPPTYCSYVPRWQKRESITSNSSTGAALPSGE